MSRRLRVILVLAMVVGISVLGVSVRAESGSIDITYNGVQVYINGVKTDFVDEYGQEIAPFIYNGKVYLPLSSIAEALGMSYEWDGSQMSAYMGVAQGDEQLMIDVCPPYQWDYCEAYTSSDGTSFQMAGASYTNGYYLDTYDGKALFNLNGAYESVSFTLGHIDGEKMLDAVLQIYLDGKLYQELPILAEGLPQKVTIPLNHALSMKWCVIDDSDGWNTGIGVGEITLK